MNACENTGGRQTRGWGAVGLRRAHNAPAWHRRREKRKTTDRWHVANQMWNRWTTDAGYPPLVRH
eukprot:3147695-Lingulodinium_polyedra.AAC.1